MKTDLQTGLGMFSPGTSDQTLRQDGTTTDAAPTGHLSVVLVSSQDGWHGGELHAALIARGLRAKWHHPVILARRHSDFARRMAVEDFEVIAYAGTGRNPLAVCQIRRVLVRVRPHVLHMNDAHAVTSAGLASLGLGIPARIAMRHVTGAIRFPGRYRAFCDRIICVAHAVADACRTSGIPDRLLRVVPCGVALDRVRQGDRARGRAAIGLPEGPQGPIVLLTVAQLSAYKGHAVALEALPAVLHRHPEVHVVFAGDGENRTALEAQAKLLGIETHVHFLGYRDDVPNLIAAADLFVLPSCHTEGIPMALLEAMLGGCPVVTTTAGGILDLTCPRNGKDKPIAWTVPPADPPALAAAILDALDDHALRADRVERARRRVLEQFTADHMVDATIGVYREVLQRL